MNKTARSDNHLMQAFRETNDERSFEELYLRYFRMIVLFQQRDWRLINWQDAEDLAETTFLKVIQSKNQFDAKRSFKAWLFTIAMNVKVDFLRKKLAFTEVAEDRIKGGFHQECSIPNDVCGFRAMVINDSERS
jgi:RNA polymerase sigma-70 factor (ECF subfamily)